MYCLYCLQYIKLNGYNLCMIWRHSFLKCEYMFGAVLSERNVFSPVRLWQKKLVFCLFLYSIALKIRFELKCQPSSKQTVSTKHELTTASLLRSVWLILKLSVAEPPLSCFKVTIVGYHVFGRGQKAKHVIYWYQPDPHHPQPPQDKNTKSKRLHCKTNHSIAYVIIFLNQKCIYINK